MPQSDFVSIFGDLPSIIQVNRELLSALETSKDRIGRVFLELAPYLKFYSTYAQEFQNSSRLVERWSERHRGFRTFLTDQETRPEVQLKLNALLITPVQRVPRYKLLIEDVIKNTPDSHPDKANLQEALGQIESVAWHINEQLREHENALKMLDIQKSLVGCYPKILTPGRRLVKQGNLMKVPKTATTSGNPRYFVLFSDMLMYCKVKIAGSGKLYLPKTNALECNFLMPLKHASVEPVVGKGVFKVTCKKEELILYSAEGQGSEEWVDAISSTIAHHKRDLSTLRKESSKREPMKRPEILKMRRESLSQIMINNSRHKMAEEEQQQKTKKGALSPRRLPFSTPSKKRPAPCPPTTGNTPGNLGSPSKHSKGATPLKTVDTNVQTPVTGSVRMRSNKVDRPVWKTLSLSRKDKLKEESSSALFRSPSIYDTQRQEEDADVMSSYLSGKICPLTPSQQQTDVSHLVTKELKQKLCSSGDEEESLGVQRMNLNNDAGASQISDRLNSNNSKCSLM